MQLLAESDYEPCLSAASPYSVAYHAVRLVALLGVDISSCRAVAATPALPQPTPPRQLALAGKIKLLLSASEADYCPQIGQRLLNTFSAAETNSAFYSLAESGWIAGQKRRRDSVSNHRRYKLSSRYLDQLEPPKALAVLRSAVWLAGGAGQPKAHGTVLVPAELDSSSVLQALEFMCAGHIQLLPRAEPPRVTPGAPFTASQTRNQGPSVRMHLLEGMLHGCRGQVRITPAQLAQLVPLVRLQARRRRYESGGGHNKADVRLPQPELPLPTERLASPPRAPATLPWEVKTTQIFKADARLPQPELPLATESRRYVKLDEAQAAAALAACVTRSGQLAANVLAAAHAHEDVGLASHVLDREIAMNATPRDQTRCECVESLKMAVEALREHSLLVRVCAGDERLYVAHAWAQCWTAEAFQLEPRTSLSAADEAVGHVRDAAEAGFEGKGELTPFGKRPEYELGSIFVAEVGHSINGEVDSAHMRAIQNALLGHIAMSPGISEASLLELVSAFSACHVREVLTSLHVHGLLRCTVLRKSRVRLVNSERLIEERLFHLKASATTGLSWLAAIDVNP